MQQLRKAPAADLMLTWQTLDTPVCTSCRDSARWPGVTVTDLIGRVSVMNKTAALKSAGELLLLWHTSDTSAAQDTASWHDVNLTDIWRLSVKQIAACLDSSTQPTWWYCERPQTFRLWRYLQKEVAIHWTCHIERAGIVWKSTYNICIVSISLILL